MALYKYIYFFYINNVMLSYKTQYDNHLTILTGETETTLIYFKVGQ